MACAQLGTEKRRAGAEAPAKLGRAEMTKTRDQEEQGMPLTRRDNDCSPEQVDRNERAASWKRCPLLGTLGRTTPAAEPFRCHFDTGRWGLKLNAVIAGAMPFRRRSGSRSGNLAAGRPFFFQFETVFGLTPAARARAKVPPKASMISAALSSEFMGRIHTLIIGIVNSPDARSINSNARKCEVVPLSQRTG
jgi:hypothetical protein